MTTSELIQRLRELDPDGQREVLYMACSDYQEMRPEELSIVVAVSPTGGLHYRSYVMRDHPSLVGKDAAARRQYVCFPGN